MKKKTPRTVRLTNGATVWTNEQGTLGSLFTVQVRKRRHVRLLEKTKSAPRRIINIVLG
jgi:hypothetical protein